MPITPNAPRTTASSRTTRAATRVKLEDLALPHPRLQLEQDDEWAVVRQGKEWTRIRLHDYDAVYAIPGLYDLWIYDVLGCTSPRRVRALLERTLADAGVDPSGLTVLDLGAGNGCVAEELAKSGLTRFVGVDIAPQAAVAAERDRPDRYLDYVVGDLTDLDEDDRKRLAKFRFNALTCVAALGFGDIPPDVFTAALRHLTPGSWVAFTLKTEFAEDASLSPFATLVKSLDQRGDLRIVARENYVHRLSSAGTPIEYTAFVARTRE